MPNPSTNLQVSAGEGMNVAILPGFAMVNGCLKLEESQKSLVIPAADANYDRIDTVVIRLDDNDSVRSCELSIIQGTPATSPVRPELTRNESVWEIGLADLLVVKNSTAITNARITDTRYETARCGVISSISEFDTTSLYQQIQSDLEGFQNISQAEFDAWFQQIKDTLSGDVAGNLQNQIGTLSNLLTTSKSDIVSAINELYNRTPDMLETLEEVDANTESGKQVDALVVKQLNRNLGGLKFGIDGDGNYGYYGADDSLIPFKSAELKTITFTEKSKTIEFDEKPIILVVYNNTNKLSCFYDCINNIGGGYALSITKNTDTNYTFNDNSGAGGGCTVLYM